jgi:hypothetical protein
MRRPDRFALVKGRRLPPPDIVDQHPPLLAAERPDERRRLSEKAEARLVAEACSQAPAGREHWTVRRLAGRVVELGLADSCSHEPVRRVLKKSGSSRG